MIYYERQPKSLYYECHVTVEPVFNERAKRFGEICREFKFKPAELLVGEGKAGGVGLSLDFFCARSSENYADLFFNMAKMMQKLQDEKFRVWSYKIVSAMLDSKVNDEYGLLI